MKKFLLFLKYSIYYIIGFISFSIIAYITQSIAISILQNTPIYVVQDIQNISNIILCFYRYYIFTYTVIYFCIVYAVCKYDKYLVNELNEKLKEIKEKEYDRKR